MSSIPPSAQAFNQQQLQGEQRAITQKAQTKTQVACTHTRGGRIIVISADGTANKFGEKNTNVVEFNSRIVKDDDQITFYISGIGTHTTSTIGSIFDMAFANSFQVDVLVAYKWLTENYRPGDRIFMFGFSRGAYQVRVIAGMIERVGLIYPGNTTQLPDVFKLYMSTTKRSNNPDSQKRRMDLCETFKSAFSRKDVKVHFVGVWDTVSSIGIRRGTGFPETVNGMSHVCHFRQALALDERRVKFWPEHANNASFNASATPSMGDVKEVWFAGCHSDIGGGSVNNEKLKLFGPALRWMTYEAMSHGLRMDPYIGRWETHQPKSSLTWKWFIVELLPIRRPSRLDHRKVVSSPHLGHPRYIQDGQRIHESVFSLMARKNTDSSEYLPCARLPQNDQSWANSASLSELKEEDPFMNVAALMNKIQSDVQVPDADAVQADITGVLHTIISTDIGKVSLTEFTGALQNLLSVAEYLRTQASVHGPTVLTLFESLVVLSADKKHNIPLSTFHSLAQKLDDFTQPKIYPRLLGVLRHASELLRSSYDLHDGRAIEAITIPAPDKVVSASDRKVLIQVEGAARSVSIGHQFTVSFSADGSELATGDEDGTIKIWDVETGKELRTFKGHSSTIRSLALSPNGRKIAAGSWDGTIRVWDYETGRDLFGGMEEHTDWVSGLAFSPDGDRLASGSDDNTVWVWDQAGKMLEGHTHIVNCVTFSKDHIISGSRDQTIRVWDAVSGDLVRVLQGHTGSVLCVAFSPDFKLVASGSRDGTARLWDVSSGEVLAIYDVGDWVVSIAFSFDGKQVVTGSARGKAHIWNADVLL